MNESALALIATARALASDAACADVVLSWRAEGIEPILLKGPTVADWLYSDAVRPYCDADLLVAPDRVIDAAAVLSRLGFVAADHHVSLHAHPWTRASDGAEIDLHVTLNGPHRPADQLWRELQDCVESGSIGREPVRVLNLPARAVLVALHARQHGADKQLEDLRRALEQAPVSLWSEAERIADRLWALAAFAEGLQMLPAGAALLEQLPLARAAFGASGSAPMAVGLTRVAMARGTHAKLGVLARGLFRPSAELPRTGRLARLPILGAPVTYAGRILWLAWNARRSLRAVRRRDAADAERHADIGRST